MSHYITYFNLLDALQTEGCPVCTLIEKQSRRRLSNELREFLRKHDYRFCHEPKGEEQDSWRKAIQRLAY